MTSSEDLSPEAQHLLRQAKGADRATRSEVSNSVQRFRQAQALRPAWQHAPAARSSRRAAPWAVFVAVLSGTLGAYATVGQSLGLPVPGWWPEFASLPAASDTAAEPARGTAARKSEAPGNQARLSASTPSQSARDAVGGAEGEGGAVIASSPVVARNVTMASPAEKAELEPPRRAASPPSSAPRATATPADQSSARPLAVPAHPAIVSPVASPAPAGPLAQEVQAITAARDAMNSRNYALAARHLDAHRLQFPKGALSEERQALSAICQCRQGQGTTAAAAYVARRPHSPLARRVAGECAIEDP